MESCSPLRLKYNILGAFSLIWLKIWCLWPYQAWLGYYLRILVAWVQTDLLECISIVVSSTLFSYLCREHFTCLYSCSLVACLFVGNIHYWEALSDWTPLTLLYTFISPLHTSHLQKNVIIYCCLRFPPLGGAMIRESVFWLITHIYFVTHSKNLYTSVHWIMLNLMI